jgi:microcystin-dependent protein
MADAYIGEIRAFPYGFIPDGWALCDGSLLNITNNTALFALIGTVYGGNGTSNFALPKLEGSVAVHHGNGFAMGQAQGETEVFLTQATMPAHNHTLQRKGSINASTGKTSAPASTSDIGSVTVIVDPTTLAHPPSFVTGSAPNTSFAPNSCGTFGNGAAHENRQPFQVLNYCIATQGYFPSF